MYRQHFGIKTAPLGQGSKRSLGRWCAGLLERAFPVVAAKSGIRAVDG